MSTYFLVGEEFRLSLWWSDLGFPKKKLPKRKDEDEKLAKMIPQNKQCHNISKQQRKRALLVSFFFCISFLVFFPPTGSQDRLNDALCATKAALEEGIVPGGGGGG